MIEEAREMGVVDGVETKSVTGQFSSSRWLSQVGCCNQQKQTCLREVTLQALTLEQERESKRERKRVRE